MSLEEARNRSGWMPRRPVVRFQARLGGPASHPCGKMNPAPGTPDSELTGKRMIAVDRLVQSLSFSQLTSLPVTGSLTVVEKYGFKTKLDVLRVGFRSMYFNR